MVNRRSAAWCILIDIEDERHQEEGNKMMLNVDHREYKQSTEIKKFFDIQRSMLIRISKRYILGFYWFGKPLRASTIMNGNIIGENVSLYACAIAGGVEGYLYPDNYISTTQLEKNEKKKKSQQGRIYGEVILTNDTAVNDQEGEAFYHHMLVKQVQSMLHDSKDKRLVSCNHKLLDEMNKQGIQCAS
jgi:hypothetical protein